MVAPLSGPRRRCVITTGWALGLLILCRPLAAQSLTEGGLAVEIILGVDDPVPEALVALEDASGGTLLHLRSDLHGLPR